MKKLTALSLVPILLLSFILSGFSYDNSQVLDIDKAVKLAIDNSPIYQTSAKKLQIADKQASDAQKQVTSYNIMTSISDEFCQLYMKPVKTLTDMRFLGYYKVYNQVAFKSTFMPRDTYYKLDVYSKLIPLSVNAKVKAAYNTVAVLKNYIELNVYNGYTTILKLDNAIKLQTDMVHVYDNQLKVAELKYKNGMLTKANLDLLNNQYQTQKIALDQYKRNKDFAILSLNRAMGLPLNTKYDSYASNKRFESYDLQPLDSYLSKALTERNEILVDSLNQNVALVTNNKTDDYLHLKDYQYDDQKKDDPNYYANLKSNFDLDNANWTLDNDKVTVEIDIRNKYKAVQNLISQYESQKADYEAEKDKLDVAAKAHTAGMLNDFDYDSEYTAVTLKKILLDNTNYDICNSVIALDYASGLGTTLNVASTN